MTSTTSAHRMSASETGCRAFGLVPPDRTDKVHGVLDTELEIEEEERKRRREDSER